MSFSYLAKISLKEISGNRRLREPVCVGVPIAISSAESIQFRSSQEFNLALVDENYREVPASFDLLDFQANSNNFSWFSVRFLADCDPLKESYLFVINKTRNQVQSIPLRKSNAVNLTASNRARLSLDSLSTIDIDLLLGYSGRKELSVKWLQEKNTQKIATDAMGNEIFRSYEYRARSHGINFKLLIEEWDDSKLIKFMLIAHNPNRAEHAKGFWDLGDPQSILMDSIDLRVSFPGDWDKSFHQINPDTEIASCDGDYWCIRQESSGGENWNSRNHIDKSGKVPLERCGFTCDDGQRRSTGLRASPWLAVGNRSVGVAIMAPNFWQTFPHGFKLQEKTFSWEILPKQSYEHELQAGEQFERTLWLEVIDISSPHVSSAVTLRNPIVPRPIVDQQTKALPEPLLLFSDQVYLTGIEKSVRAMFAKGEGFLAKREIIDEYGWRNFGEVWADHEQSYAQCPSPIISHYNNQYDLLYGFLSEFLRSGDPNAALLAYDLASHVLNIDIYRTEDDRAAFNNGLFWHTAHYRDALTSTHRCYSRGMLTGSHRVQGGGLANEHMYTQGFTLFYLLTGDVRYRETVIKMAERVILMDDGNHHWMSPFSAERTGAASATATDGYHGPGRGVGNSINCLIDGWCLTKDKKFIEKGVELITRMMHPQDSIESFDLGNAELRWSYTVAVQSMVRWLMIIPDGNGIHSYIRKCLINIGDWMLENEGLYLDNPDQLEFPTETWAAQDLRKANCMIAISQLIDGDKSRLLREKGVAAFDSAWRTLTSFDSCKFTRPCAISLQQLPFYFTETTLANLEKSKQGQALPEKREFLSQKNDVKKKLKNLRGIMSMIKRALINPGFVVRFISNTSLGSGGRKLGRFLRNFSNR